jgi:Cdc6-like AAA superfamily ATPase
MSTTAQLVPLKPKPSQKPSIELVNEEITSPHKVEEDVPCSADDDEDSNQTQTINNVESLRRGIVKTSKNHTILLVGEPGVGKSSFSEFIANVLIGNDMDHYDFDILDHTNEKVIVNNNQPQTNEARLYEITSTNGVVVSAGACERGEYALTLNLSLPRFASSTPLGWSTLTMLNMTRRALQLRSRTISTPSPRFSSLPMAPSRAIPAA